MPWVYILECSDHSFYVGSASELETRVSQHNLGLGAAYTRRRLPVVLRWAEFFTRVDDAFAAEKRLQGWGRRKRQALIDGETDLLPKLASRSWAARRDRGSGDSAGGGVS